MADIAEPAFIPAVFVDDLAEAEVDRFGLARLTFTAEQREAHSGTVERIISARLILPAAVLADVAARLLSARSRSPATAADPIRSVN